jgi:hypothetical protein
MFLDYGDTREGRERMWKCLGCGREVFVDAAKQAEDERVRELIRRGEAVS